MNTAIALVQPVINPFSFLGHDIRTTVIGDDVWFCAKDVFESLDVKWSGTGTTLRNTPDKWVCTLQHRVENGEKELVFLSEPGVYRVLFRSNKPEAERFAEWVCEEVLPAIRKTGFYGRVDPKTRVVISKQVSALVAELVGCRNLMQQEYLIGEIRDLCNMIGKPMPDMTKLHTEVNQGVLPFGGGAA